MTNYVFMVRNMFCPHKDYGSFVGGKLTMFKFCNYGFVLANVSRAIFGIVLAYFIVYETYFIIYDFCRTIRVVNVYFIVYN
jgi:hypothetical protein